MLRKHRFANKGGGTWLIIEKMEDIFKSITNKEIRGYGEAYIKSAKQSGISINTK
jgi:hypothetical protein